jgi:hypothetical protein
MNHLLDSSQIRATTRGPDREMIVAGEDRRIVNPNLRCKLAGWQPLTALVAPL